MDKEYNILRLLGSRVDALKEILNEEDRKELFAIYSSSKRNGGGYEDVVRSLKEKDIYYEFKKRMEEYCGVV